jgi:hypothetical protein
LSGLRHEGFAGLQKVRDDRSSLKLQNGFLNCHLLEFEGALGTFYWDFATLGLTSILGPVYEALLEFLFVHHGITSGCPLSEDGPGFVREEGEILLEQGRDAEGFCVAGSLPCPWDLGNISTGTIKRQTQNAPLISLNQ